MNRFGIWAAAGAMLALGAGVAWAQERGPRDGWRGGDRTPRAEHRGDRTPRGDRAPRGDWNRGDRTPRGDWNRGDRNPRGDWSGGRHWRGDRHRDGWRGERYSGRHWSRPYYPRHYGWRDWGPRYSWSSPYYYWGGYPTWLYGAALLPFYGSYVEWDPPLYVERIIEREPVYIERAYQEPRERSERSYAQVAPPPAPPPPRLERYTLSATELFEFDKATLRMPQPKLDEIAQAMRRDPQIDQVTITGHTDRIGSDAYNLKLSRQRAEAVKAYLVGKGVESRRLVAVGKGKAEPVVQCNDKDRAALIRCLEPNRRVEVEQITVEVRK
jgi:outer membrane protein OmpA-like peptidoglycan-associated protein